MSSEHEIDYAAVLTDLKAKRDKLDAAITGIETMLGIRGLVAVSQSSENAAEVVPTNIGPGAFLGLSIADATKKLLAARRKQMRTEEILNELRAGGMVFSDPTPSNTLGSILNREYSNDAGIVRVGRGVWGLAEWHPRLRKKALASNGTDADGNERADLEAKNLAELLGDEISEDSPAS